MSVHAIEAASKERLQTAFQQEELAALRLLMRARLVIIALILIWVHIENPLPIALKYDPLVISFLVPTVVPYWLRRRGYFAAWPRYAFPFLDMLLMVVIALAPNMNGFPRQMTLRYGNELYLFLLLTSTVLSYSPSAVLWAGFSAAGIWALGNLWIYLLPDTVLGVPGGTWTLLTVEERLAVALDPHRVNTGMFGRQVMLLLVISAVLALAVRRSRALLQRQTESERERANLSRYFSPNMVEELAQSDEPLRTTRTQATAVLFVDLVGFTQYSATQQPEMVIRLLRDFHGRMVKAVFENGGTLNKFLGDGLMATFGTPRVSEDDATRALRCARAMLAAMDRWNAERNGGGEPPLRIGMGIHYGQVVLGDIGDERHLEFAVIGDTVNVASRLQQLTRSLDTQLVVSHALIERARREPNFSSGELKQLVEVGEQEIRGRAEGLRIWKHEIPVDPA